MEQRRGRRVLQLYSCTAAVLVLCCTALLGMVVIRVSSPGLNNGDIGYLEVIVNVSCAMVAIIQAPHVANMDLAHTKCHAIAKMTCT